MNPHGLWLVCILPDAELVDMIEGFSLWVPFALEAPMNRRYFRVFSYAHNVARRE